MIVEKYAGGKNKISIVLMLDYQEQLIKEQLDWFKAKGDNYPDNVLDSYKAGMRQGFRQMLNHLLLHDVLKIERIERED